MMTKLDRLDAETRQTLIDLTLCDPSACELARTYLQLATRWRGTSDQAVLELIGWLQLGREYYGLPGFGHA